MAFVKLSIHLSFKAITPLVLLSWSFSSNLLTKSNAFGETSFHIGKLKLKLPKRMDYYNLLEFSSSSLWGESPVKIIARMIPMLQTSYFSVIFRLFRDSGAWKKRIVEKNYCLATAKASYKSRLIIFKLKPSTIFSFDSKSKTSGDKFR